MNISEIKKQRDSFLCGNPALERELSDAEYFDALVQEEFELQNKKRLKFEKDAEELTSLRDEILSFLGDIVAEGANNEEALNDPFYHLLKFDLEECTRALSLKERQSS